MTIKTRINLEKYLINQDKPNGQQDPKLGSTPEWFAGEQLKALRFYLSKEIEIIKEYKMMIGKEIVMLF